jgi:transcriptional regulator with XRE-family HTH domain
MPSREAQTRNERTRPHVVAFAHLLKSVRHQAGLTVRQLGKSITYSHPHVARATTGKKLPSWSLTEAYLTACGVVGPDLQAWRRLWILARDKERQFRRAANASGPPPPDLSTDLNWQNAIAAIRRIEPLVTFLQRVATLDDLSIALVRLGLRNGNDSLRKVETATGIPRATLHGWYSGRRKPSEARLDQLVVGLSATRAEQHEFAQCLERIADTIPCDGINPQTGEACTLGHEHKGYHRADDGATWLDDV